MKVMSEQSTDSRTDGKLPRQCVNNVELVTQMTESPMQQCQKCSMDWVDDWKKNPE